MCSLYLLLAVLLLGCGTNFVDDKAGILSESEKARIGQYNDALLRDVRINIIVVTLKDSPENIDRSASDMFGEYVSKTSKGDSKGVLFLIDPKGEQVRVEVGYGLEHVFTDGFVGYIERRQMVPFFRSGKVGPGVEATVELMVGKALGELDESAYALDEPGEFLSGGAGAKTDVEIGSGAEPKDKVSQPDEYAAQPTPELALDAYRRSLVRHVKDPNLGVYTPETREFFSKWTVTDAQQDNALRTLEESIAQQRVKTMGDLAVIVFPVGNRQASPYFLVNGNEGWMLDFAAMSRVIAFNHKNQWHMRSYDHPYMFAFDDVRFDTHGFPHTK
jgi:hypothetical protein